MSDGQGYLAELAWLGGDQVVSDLLIEVADGRIVALEPTSEPTPGVTRLPGLTVPGLANAHSHVFHRAIRGRTESGSADFWQWRDLMYLAAERLDPDRYYEIARATYAEMAMSGITTVGEFHYVHHGPDGIAYNDPNAMGAALVAGARAAGIRITLLDTCYLTADVTGRQLTGVQRRFDDGTAAAWRHRVEQLSDAEDVRIGAAIHSVRAVPAEAMSEIADYTQARGLPLHFHLSEQPAENEACLAATGLTPTALLQRAGALGPASTAVHATHLTDADVAALGTSGTALCMCPTTERDLADGIGPAGRLRDAGSRLCVGSDGHMVIDLWEEMRGVELDERLASGRRGRHTAVDLLTAGTAGGMAALGWDGGTLAVGGLADFVSVRLDTPRMAGTSPREPIAHAVFAATGADVGHVVVGGRLVVQDSKHLGVGDVAAALASAIAPLVDEWPTSRIEAP